MAGDLDGQQDQQRSPGGSTPVPDPTVLTTEALQREIASLKELIEYKVNAQRQLGESKLAAEHQQCLEKFESIETQLQLIERQRVEQKEDTKAAVDAALAAAKEAVKEQTTASERAIAKSETATTKSIDQLGATFKTSEEGLRREIGDLKDRVLKAEGQKAGGREVQAQQSVTFGQGLAAVSVVLLALSIIAGIVLAVASP